jgi:hypothetical protein
MKSPENTTKTDPAILLLEAMLSPDTHIERMEKDGQTQLVDSDVLPTEMEAWEKEKLESLGVEFLGVVPEDEIFTYVKLPVGWKKVSAEHDMWSTLVDETGKEIAGMFYKAAFYDRSSYLYLKEGK